ncbi:outer membrane beta-barrel protein [Hymenobacter cellulosivorans]|uniref:PorT family protein n=1 Tax=Hymenobacter cellulosivorans TaxID=2932249 RepID=A0ABY4F4R1_9BACT|nr:outer membrane beta-barrel protein [Hymenobacter cellulosivorans]UOQ50909.1 PorT family protein [Hymenobacter cellulosivorans]
MTEHESEQFYKDLQQKLHGYGSAPPETVWRGIREQVPARKRRFRPVLWLLLVGALLVGVTVGTQQWGHAVFGPGTAADPAPVASRSEQTGSEARSSAGNAAGQPNGAVATTEPRGNAADQLGNSGNAAGNDNITPADSNPAATTASASSGARNARTSAASKQLLLARIDTRGKRAVRIGAASHSDAARSSTQPGEEGSATAASASKAVSAATASTTAARNRSLRRNARNSAPLLAAAGARAAATRKASFSASRRAATELARTASASHSRTVATRSAISRTRVGRSAASRSAAATPTLLDAEAMGTRDLASTESVASIRRRRAQQAKISNEPLDLLVIRPEVAEAPEPEVKATRRRPARRPTRQEIRLRNWSAQLLLGSGLSYRALGGSATPLERLERPSMSFSGQATATYALSRQLAMSAGLGYSEYATSLNYRLRKGNSDSLGMQQKKFRDVYRFLTIPVQAQLTLAGNARWRYGVQFGGTVAFLTDAKTTEGSACNCQQVQWSSSTRTMPFNRTNLTLTGGAFASYQFAPGQWFTLRPQGDIFLNSVSTGTSGRAPRRPWNLGLQAGYSWDLDPRKH